VGMGNVELSVVIPAHNAEVTITDQLDALTRQKARGEWEVIVVDDESTDETVALATRYRDGLPLVVVSTPPGVPSPARARNVGVQAARGDVVLFCDADDVVDDNWLATLQEALDGHSLVAGRWDELRLNSPETLTSRGPLWQGLMGWYGAFLPYAASCALGVRRRVHEAVGGFDESFVRGGEEMDYCWRIQQATDEPLHYVPDAVVHYRYRSGAKAIFRQARNYGASEVYVYAKWRASLPVPENQWRAGCWAAVRTFAAILDIRNRATFHGWLWKLGYLLGHFEASRRLHVLLLCSNPNLARDPVAHRFDRLRRKLSSWGRVEQEGS
jgi:glycosyltransferase involved in cell wall biosynthesis